MTCHFLPLVLAAAEPNANIALVVLIVSIALIFDFSNGFHDSANSIATLVATKALSPRIAVVWAAFFNFAALFFMGYGVAKTIGHDIVDPLAATDHVVLSALLGAIAWNLLTWYFGIPSSSSHALIGGFLGAGIASAGFSVVKWGGLRNPLLAIVLSPTLCLLAGYLIMVPLLWICRNLKPDPVNRAFKGLQFVAAAIFSLAHGGNDAQKTIGIIAALLVGERLLEPEKLASGELPTWIAPAAFLAIGLGTLSGGWRIVKTMGTGITKMKPVDGFGASLSAGGLIIAFTHWGIPVSTTHSITGAIMGVGATKRLSAVRWGISARIIWAWILTIPMSSLIACLFFWIIRMFGLISQ